MRYVREFFRGWESLGLREYEQVVPSYVVPSLVLTYLSGSSDVTIASTLGVDNRSLRRAVTDV